MPKEKSSYSALLRHWIEDVCKDEFVIDGNDIFCTICSKKVNCKKKFQLTQHFSSGSHQASRVRNSKQRLISHTFTEVDTHKTFCKDLCVAFISSNIPIKKLNNPTLKKFLTKYMKMSILDESTIRKNYLNSCYEDTISSIQNLVKNSLIYVIVDETTDLLGRYVANCLIGKIFF